jgi:flagellar motor switch protein FliM
MASDRLPTPLEESVVARRLSAALAPVVAALEEFGIRRLELAPTTVDELHVAPELVRIAVELLVGEVQGVVDLCLPVSLFVAAPEPIADLQPPAPQVAAALGNVPVTMAVRFAPVVLRASDVEGLAVGDVIRLDHPVDQPLVGEVDGTPLVLAQAGRRGRRLAVEVVRRF